MLAIIEKYGKGEIDVQIQQVKQILEFLIGISSSENDTASIYEVRQMHESLFPPRGGLTDFFIWANDYDERVRFNEPLDNIKKDIHHILHDALDKNV